jgi:hypothetical protein
LPENSIGRVKMPVLTLHAVEGNPLPMTSSKSPKPATRKDKLAAALKANLAKRKSQAKARKTRPTQGKD